ncbi:ATP-binding cassette domain-containing protein [Mycoplasma sp. P36-A1]|uniref:ABC transporter ATP-binding protein/permease n=1 Tax=Mycoplasma sp. P36-A1 TaxID=3252900 RepID=UPI003C2D4507
MLLELKNITKVYGSEKNGTIQKALDNVNLGFDRQEFVSILGPSGGGKSTLLNVIAGLDRPTSGELLIEGKTTKKFKDKNWDFYRKNNVGFVFQQFNLIEHLTAIENVEIVMTLTGINKAERRKRALELLKEVGLEERVDHLPSMLSGGQKQRVAIARALANDPDIILADEPTGALDTKTGLSIMNLLSEISKDKLVIMVTHNRNLAYEYSTRVVSIADGKIINDEVLKTNEKNIKNTSLSKKDKSMPFKEAIRLSFRNMVKKKGRIILTAFAGSIGIAGISLVMGLGNGTTNFINNEMVKFGSSNVATIAITTKGDDNQLNKVSKKADYEFVTDNDDILQLRRKLTDQGTWLINDESEDVTAYALASPDNQEYLEEFITGDLPKEGKNQLLVNQAYARAILKATGEKKDTDIKEAIGKSVELDLSSSGFAGSQKFKVSGIVNEIDVDTSMLYYNYEDMKDFYKDTKIPMTTETVYSSTSQKNPEFEITVKNPHELTEVQQWVIENYPGETSKVASANPMASMIGNRVGISMNSFALIFYQALSTIISMAQLVMILFLVVALIVSSILIAIVQFSSVLERKVEIGILKAVGARKKDVIRVFESEAIMLGLLAGLIGVGLSFVIAPIAEVVVTAVTGFDATGLLSIPLTLNINGSDYYLLPQIILILISVIVAAIAGYLPARRATKMQVIDALRDE